MTSPTLHLAFVAHPSEDRALFLSRLVRHGNVEPDDFLSFDELRRGSCGRSYSGVVVDLKTLSLLEADERPFFEELAGSLPVLRIRRVGEPDEISGTVEGRPLAGEALLAAFVDGLCRKARPRGIRAEERRNLVLSVLVRETPDGEPFRASIANVSRGGFFVVTPRERGGDRVHLEIQELTDRTPIVCETRWAMPWGASRRSLPGYGVAIDSIRDGQRAELEKLLAEAPVFAI